MLQSSKTHGTNCLNGKLVFHLLSKNICFPPRHLSPECLEFAKSATNRTISRRKAAPTVAVCFDSHRLSMKRHTMLQPTSATPALPDLPAGVEVVRYAELAGVPCPCGSAKRGFMESAGVPFSLHITTISETARLHYHKRLTETYLILECEPGALLELNDCRLPLAAEMAILIPPGTRHRAIGKMKVAIVAWPKFDPTDEWFD